MDLLTTFVILLTVYVGLAAFAFATAASTVRARNGGDADGGPQADEPNWYSVTQFVYTVALIVVAGAGIAFGLDLLVAACTGQRGLIIQPVRMHNPVVHGAIGLGFIAVAVWTARLMHRGLKTPTRHRRVRANRTGAKARSRPASG